MRSIEVVKSIFELDFLCFCHFVCFQIVRNAAAKRALQLALQVEVQVRINMHVHVCAVLHFADSRSHSLFYDRKIYCASSAALSTSMGTKGAAWGLSPGGGAEGATFRPCIQ